MARAGDAEVPAPVGAEAEFVVACRDAVAFARRLADGTAAPPGAELPALARRAVEAQAARRGEDVAAWAWRLAADVAECCD